MQPRQLKRLINVPVADRNSVIAEGLRKLGGFVERLTTDAAWLQDNGRPASAAILDVYAREQAASFVILLDLVRGGWRCDSRQLPQRIGRFYDHLARGLYAMAYETRPATLREIDKLLEFERRSMFLDGPNDVDWIIGNEISARREGALYVDYLGSEGDYMWESPLERENGDRCPARIVDLVLSLRAAGICSAAALDGVGAVWDEIDIADRDLHWQTVLLANRETLNRLARLGGDVGKPAAQRIVHDWIHPLNDLDMAPIKITEGELRSRRERWVAQQWGWDEPGY